MNCPYARDECPLDVLIRRLLMCRYRHRRLGWLRVKVTKVDYEGVSDSQDDAREASPAEALIGMMRDQLSNPQLIAASLRGLEQLASAPPAATPDAIRAEIAAKGKYEASTPPSSLLYRCSCR